MIDLLNATLRLSCPLFFAALGGLLCERSGVPTLCLEGVLLLAAFTSATVAHFTQSVSLSIFAAMLSGALLMSFHGLLTQKARAHSIVSGMAINIFVAGLTPLLCKVFFDNTTNTPSLPLSSRLLALPGLSHNILLGVAVFLPFLLHFLLYRTRFGLRVRSAGDGAQALQASGVSVTRIRLKALCFGGALTSLGGVYLAIGHSSQFLRDMTAGKGFIALAALIVGSWKPIPTFFACLLFGGAEALQMSLQNLSFMGYTIPFQWSQCLPYFVTLLILVSAGAKAKVPKALTSENTF